MELKKLLQIENDGVHLVVDGQYLYMRCKRSIYKFNLRKMQMSAENIIFDKDNQTRLFSIHGDRIFLSGFLDLYMLDKSDLQVKKSFKLGENNSSDVGGVLWFDLTKAYIGTRNGWIFILDVDSGNFDRIQICNASFWSCYITENHLFLGTTKGELHELSKSDFQLIRKAQLGRTNIAYMLLHGNSFYTIARDKFIKVVDTATLEVTRLAKNVVSTMASLVGIYKDYLIVADWGKVSLWDINTLKNMMSFHSLPTNLVQAFCFTKINCLGVTSITYTS